MNNSSSAAHPSHASTATTTAALQGTTTPINSACSVNTSFSFDDFNFSADTLTAQDQRDESLRVMKFDLMASLNKEVKSLDEDSWMFDGPRSRINLISRPGGSFSTNTNHISSMWQAALSVHPLQACWSALFNKLGTLSQYQELLRIMDESIGKPSGSLLISEEEGHILIKTMLGSDNFVALKSALLHSYEV